MKTIKRILVTVLVLGFVAATSVAVTGCMGGKVCQAKKTNNHR